MGHWANPSFGGGISTVANNARKIAHMIQHKDSFKMKKIIK